MSFYTVNGARELRGSITPQGAKNEALQALTTCLLCDEEVIVENVPDILDIQNHLKLLESLNVQVTRLSEGKFRLKSRAIESDFYTRPDFKILCGATRGSLIILGPLITKLSFFEFYAPGGDNIGRRNIDPHIKAFEKLGVHFDYDASNHVYTVNREDLHAESILMEEASVTGTANLIMAAVLIKGTTTLYNAACEPYIQQLCFLLNNMGAKISGIASNLLTIEGVEHLHKASHRVLPDMIEVGSFIGMAAATHSQLLIKDVCYPQLGLMPIAFQRLGVHLERINGDDIWIDGHKDMIIKKNIDKSIVKIDDAPWPGLSPDMISIMLVTATQAKGTVLIYQKMFESRLFFVDKLIAMGAHVILCDPHRVTVIGSGEKYSLNPIQMSSPDIRAGISLLIAALCAKGESTIYNIHQIDRGYNHLDKRLNALGAEIKRFD